MTKNRPEHTRIEWARREGNGREEKRREETRREEKSNFNMSCYVNLGAQISSTRVALSSTNRFIVMRESIFAQSYDRSLTRGLHFSRENASNPGFHCRLGYLLFKVINGALQ